MEQSQKPRDLQFINLTERATLDKDDQTTVRTHVMRDFTSKCKSVRRNSYEKEIEETDSSNASHPSNEAIQEVIRFKLGPAGMTGERRKAFYRTPKRDVPHFSRKSSGSSIGDVENEGDEKGSVSVGISMTSKTASRTSLQMSSESKCPQNEQFNTSKGTTTPQSGRYKSGEPINQRRKALNSSGSSDTAPLGTEPKYYYQSNLGADLVDPFNTVPGLNTRRTSLLISHCKLFLIFGLI
jgi:hypothetical protein